MRYLPSQGRARTRQMRQICPLPYLHVACRQFISADDELTRAGAAMMSASHRSLVRMIKDGCRLAIDETLLDAQIGPDYADLLVPGDPVVLLAYFPDRA